MKKGFKRSVFFVFLLLLPAAPAAAGYNSILKKWTRKDQVYVMSNMEARLIWSATYLSDEFRQAKRERLAELFEWDEAEKAAAEKEDLQEAAKYDVFFLGVYAGSSEIPEIGKDVGSWRIVLETGEGDTRRITKEVSFQRKAVTHTERELYPYLDKWSEAYEVKFPKTIQSRPFKLRFTGIPARSELIWK